MIELVYPSGIAPRLRESGIAVAAEMLPVVDANGFVSAQASRDYCHSGAKPLHPVVHLHIINREGQVYLQQRGAHKSLLPLMWDTAVGGHVSYGEYIVETLYREAQEELGLVDFHPYALLSYEFESQTERELVNVYATVGNFPLRPNPDELEGGRFWSPAEIEANIGKGVFTPNFESEYARIKDALQSLL